MYEDLVKRLIEDKSWLEHGYLETEFEIAGHIKRAADAIEELSKKYLQAEIDATNLTGWLAEEHAKHLWIPVTARLPKEEKCKYWCYTDAGVMCECRWTNNKFGLGVSDRWGWSVVDVPQYQEVTHWMPLPEPPKEEP